MNSKLIRALTKLCDSCTPSKSTNSLYFNIGCIIVRVSDHISYKSTYDLAIFINPRGYMIIPTIAAFKEVKYVSNIKECLNYIIYFEHFYKIFYKPNLVEDDQPVPTNVIDNVDSINLKSIISDPQYEVLQRSGYTKRPYIMLIYKLLSKITTDAKKNAIITDLWKRSYLSKEERVDYIKQLISQN